MNLRELLKLNRSGGVSCFFENWEEAEEGESVNIFKGELTHIKCLVCASLTEDFYRYDFFHSFF